jgi:hypothetical protein
MKAPPIEAIETSSIRMPSPITKFHEVLRQAEPVYAMLKELKKKVTCPVKGTIIGDADKLKGVEEFKRRRPFPATKTESRQCHGASRGQILPYNTRDRRQDASNNWRALLKQPI